MATDSACIIVTDPFCGASFDRDKAAASYDFQGFAYYFCSSACRREVRRVLKAVAHKV